MSTQGKNSEKGFALVGSMALLMVLGVFGFAFLKMSGYEAEAAGNRYLQMKAFWKAEEALSQASAQIEHMAQPAGFSGQTPVTQGLFARYLVERVYNRPNYALQVRADAYSVKNEKQPLLSLVARHEARSASQYFFIEDHAPSNEVGPYYFTGDTIDGPVHTNTRFKVTGKPVFLGSLFESGHINQKEGFICRGVGECQPQIESVPRWGARVYDFENMAVQIRHVQTRIAVPPHRRAELTLHGDKYRLRFRDVENPAIASAPRESALPSDNGLYFLGDVEVRGVLKGQLTIGARGNIVITDDLVYADSHPKTGRPPQNSANVLGLISERNVKVNQQQENNEIGRGIRINASVVAMDKSFEVADTYRRHKQTMGTMHFWGNIMQVERGAVGSYSIMRQRLLGYSKKWHYDRRFQHLSLPHFPPLTDAQGMMDFERYYWGRYGV